MRVQDRSNRFLTSSCLHSAEDDDLSEMISDEGDGDYHDI